MTIGSAIKNYRKRESITQKEMATCLGVTVTTIRKWEKGEELPDISLLVPISRLLGITTDELLSSEENLTNEEITLFLLEMRMDLLSKGFHDVFLSVKEKIEQYPNCEKLIWVMTVFLDEVREEIPNKDDYDDAIYSWYERCLFSEHEEIRSHVASLLFDAFAQKEDYERAAEYLDYFCSKDPDLKLNEALINSKIGDRNDAYRIYEDFLIEECLQIEKTLSDLRVLYMEDDNHEMANKLVEISSSLASIFERGKYAEVCVGLDVAVWEKDSARTLQIMKEILSSIETMSDFTKSELYRHMDFRTIDSGFFEEAKQELLSYVNDESFDFMEGNEDWEKLKSDFHQ